MTVQVTGKDFSAEELRRKAGRVRNASRRCWRWHPSWMALRAAQLPRMLVWTGRLCATGFTVITPRTEGRGGSGGLCEGRPDSCEMKKDFEEYDEWDVTGGRARHSRPGPV